MTVLLLFSLAALLLTSKRRSTVEPGTREDSLWPPMQHSCTACASSRIAILVSKPQMFSGSNATSLLLQLCLLRERAGLRPRAPTSLLRETVRLRPWTRGLMLLRERTGLWPRVTTTVPSENRQAPAVGGRPFSVQNSVFFGSSGRGLGTGRECQPRSSERPSGSGCGRGSFFCPEFRVLRLIPTGVETRIPTGAEMRTNFRSGRQRFPHAAHARRLYQPSCGQQ